MIKSVFANPVKERLKPILAHQRGDIAKRLGRGLQNLLDRFDSDCRLHQIPHKTNQRRSCLDGGIGRRVRLKISCPQGRPGSIPGPGTNSRIHFSYLFSVLKIYLLLDLIKKVDQKFISSMMPFLTNKRVLSCRVG